MSDFARALIRNNACVWCCTELPDKAQSSLCSDESQFMWSVYVSARAEGYQLVKTFLKFLLFAKFITVRQQEAMVSE